MFKLFLKRFKAYTNDELLQNTLKNAQYEKWM